MLITVSGMVGSGKTTIVREIVTFAAAHGIAARAHRFQSLPCISFRLRPSQRARNAESQDATKAPAPASPRWSGYTRKRLTAAAVVVFIVRIVAFRVYRRTLWRAAEWHVLNRYFYDSLCHYQPRSSVERLYYAIVTASIPRPDVAILVTAGLDTIHARRPEYAREYVELVGESYARVAADIPGLIALSTEPGEPTVERLIALVQARLG